MKARIRYFALSGLVLLSATFSEAYIVEVKPQNEDKHRLENTDYKGTLAMEGIFRETLYAPVDNQKYLFNNAQGEKDRHGELFLSSNSGTVVADLSLIYGHNNYDGSKFGNLSYVLGMDDVPDLNYEYLGTTETYAFGFVFEFDDGSQVLEQQLIGEQRMTYVESLKRSAIKVNTDQLLTGEIVFLQTCIGAYGNQRYVFAFTRVSR